MGIALLFLSLFLPGTPALAAPSTTATCAMLPKASAQHCLGLASTFDQLSSEKIRACASKNNAAVAPNLNYCLKHSARSELPSAEKISACANTMLLSSAYLACLNWAADSAFFVPEKITACGKSSLGGYLEECFRQAATTAKLSDPDITACSIRRGRFSSLEAYRSCLSAQMQQRLAREATAAEYEAVGGFVPNEDGESSAR